MKFKIGACCYYLGVTWRLKKGPGAIWLQLRTHPVLSNYLDVKHSAISLSALVCSTLRLRIRSLVCRDLGLVYFYACFHFYFIEKLYFSK